LSDLTIIFIDVAAVIMLAGLLGTIAAIDMREKRIPNILVLAVGVLGLLVSWFAPLITRTPTEALIGAGVFGGVVLLTAVVTSVITKEEAIGGGDIKLAIAAGTWLGWSWVGVYLLVSCLFFLCAAGVYRLAGHNDRVLPFGPMLGGTLILLILLRIAAVDPAF